MILLKTVFLCYTLRIRNESVTNRFKNGFYIFSIYHIMIVFEKIFFIDILYIIDLTKI
jgi:hypothetical protein